MTGSRRPTLLPMNVETWIVIADASRARIYSFSPERVPALSSALDHDLVATRLRNQSLDADRPGQTTQRAQRTDHAASPHGVAPETDSHRLAQIELSRAVAHELEAARLRGLGRIVLVAPPRALGDIRKACTPGVRALITDELGKDLTRMPVHDLSDHLAGVIGEVASPRVLGRKPLV
jgi:protein required for attachment to host cells